MAAIVKTGDIHTDTGSLYYDQIKTPLAELQAQMAALVAQQASLQAQINIAIPVDRQTRVAEFVQDLSAYFASKNATNGAKLAAFFVNTVTPQPFASILANVDAYLAAGGI